MRSWSRYAVAACAVTAAAVLAAWPLLSGPGRRGLVGAAGTALGLQLALFGALATRRSGSPGFLAAWVVGSLMRLLAVGALALWAARSDAVDTLSTMLALVGLLFVLLLLEPWALRERTRTTDSNETTRA